MLARLDAVRVWRDVGLVKLDRGTPPAFPVMSQAQVVSPSLSFIANAGQTDPAVRFQLNGAEQTVFFTPKAVFFSATRSPAGEATTDLVRLSFVAANPAPTIEGLEPLPGMANFFRGNDPAGWQTDVPTYGAVTYHDLYPGIDLVYRGSDGYLKSEFLVAPGTDPALIQLIYEGIEAMQLRSDGAMVLQSQHGELVEAAPVVYQDIAGERVLVEGRYHLLGNNRVGFHLGRYNAAYPLIIDPTLGYSSYLGGSNTDEAHDVAIDDAGNVYVIGQTNSVDFPTKDPLQPAPNGGDVFVAKFDPNGTRLYATYLGGDNLDFGYGIAVDSAGNAYLTGETGTVGFNQTPFPTTPGTYQTTYSGPAVAFITKLNPTGSARVYSTLFGGSGITNNGFDIEVDNAGNAYIFGITSSSDLPLQNPAQATYGGGLHDSFVTKLNLDGSALVYSTYLGGSGDENSSILAGGGGIALDSNGNAYVTDKTTSDDLPVTTNAFDKTLTGNADAFVAKLNPGGNQFVYLTYLGGTDFGLEEGLDIAVNSAGQAYVTGYTSAIDFPTRKPLYAAKGGVDLFITELNSAGSDLIYSTVYGGDFGADYGLGIALDYEANIYVTGSAQSPDFPTKFALQSDSGGGADVFVLKLNPAGNSVIYSTYLGGEGGDAGQAIAAANLGNEGRAYVVGEADDTFPVQNAAQSSFGGGFADGFVAKINDVFFEVYLPVVIK